MGALFRKWFVPHKGNNHQPHFLRLETLSVALFLLVLLQVGFFLQAFSISQKPNFLASILPGVLVDITNQDRSDNQAAPLAPNALLQLAAQEKADDMASKGYFAHVTPEGYTPWHWLDQAGYSYKYAGENLAVNFFDSADVATAWMNSPEHRANVVKKEYTEIGIAMAEGQYQGHSTVFVVEFFGTPKPPAVAVVKPVTPIVGTPAASNALAVATPIPATAAAIPAHAPASAVTATAANPAPAVLGAESGKASASAAPAPASAAPAAVAPAAASPKIIPEAATASFWEKIAASPRALNAGLLKALLWATLFALAILAVTYSHSRHKKLFMNGAAFAVAILSLLAFNAYFLGTTVKLPSGDQSASVSAALQ